MEKLSYNIVFNNHNPCGFADIKNSSDTDADSSTDAGMIDNVMKRFNETILVNHQCKITRVSASSFKLVYECSYHGNYKCEHVKDTVNLDYFGSFYNSIVYNSDMVKYLRTKDIVTSVDFNDTYLSTGFYEYKAIYSNRNELINVAELHGEKVIDKDSFGKNIIIANGYDVLRNIDDTITFLFTVYTNSPIVFSFQRVWAIENNVQPLQFGIIYKPGKLSSYLLGLNKLESLHARYLYSKN